MAKLPRVTNKRFGADANLSDVGQFGGAAAGTKLDTKDIAAIQALPAWSSGWAAATMSGNKYPTRQERNGVDYVHAYQIDYMLREGMPEYDSQTEYSDTSIVKAIEDDKVVFYHSIINNNIGQSLDNTAAWEKVSIGGGGLEIGDIGIAPLGIDETQNKRRYLNGQLIIQDQFVSFTTKLKNAVTLYPSLACTEAEWQTAVTMSPNGTCDKFVIDDVAGTIRLPKYPNYCSKEYLSMGVAGTGKTLGLSVYDNTSPAGIKNGGLVQAYNTGWAGANNCFGIQPSALDKNVSSTAESWSVLHAANSNTNAWTIGVVTDASKSGLEVDLNSATSELIACKWFIQVATGVEESIDVTREIELNNPFCLLDYKYSEYELDNISWLRSNGQWNAKAVFTDAYDLLLKIYNGTETKAGVSVKLSTETYADTDFVLNTSDETFRLPLKVALASGKAVVGNGKALGLTMGSSVGDSALAWTNAHGATARTAQIGQNVGHTSTTDTYWPASVSNSYNYAIGVTTDATKSGLELSDANLYLYFYVGETVQNANLINAGRIEEKLVDKADKIEVDGQWVRSTLHIADTVTYPTTTNIDYDLSSYLPNDNYNYEVLISSRVITGTTSGNQIRLVLDTELANDMYMCGAITRTSSSAQGAGTSVIPVGSDRIITVGAAASFVGTFTMNAVAYRRIGTNS